MIAGAERRKGAYTWLVFAGLVAVASVVAFVCLSTRIVGLAWTFGVGSAVVVSLILQLRLQREIGFVSRMVDALPHTDPNVGAPTLSEFDPALRSLEQASRQLEGRFAESSASRRELETLLDSMQDPVFAVDAAGRIQWNNHRMQLLMPRSGFGGVRVGHSLVQTIRDPEVLDCVRAALEQGTVTDRRSTTLMPGRIFAVNASPTPSGGVVTVLHDITRVEEVERTQRDFVANVSHELRTPLTSISGYVEILLDHEAGLTPQAREFLETILKNASRMTRLTEDLLVMARVEAATFELHPAPVRASTLMADAVDGITGLILESEATLIIGESTDASVLADLDATMQVLGNLIENALKYGRNGTPAEVTLSARVVHEPHEAVEFSVSDKGPGIASEHLARIFERFYRVDKARSRESGGTGLGLSIVRHMVQAQGGDIRAESLLGAGSSFLFTLPLAPGEQVL